MIQNPEDEQRQYLKHIQSFKAVLAAYITLRR